MKRAFSSVIALVLLAALMFSAGIQREERTRSSDNRQQTGYSIDHNTIDDLQKFFPSTLAATEKHFLRRQAQISGFGAGTTYPQIWLRDSATAIPVSRYYYPSEYLTTWIEEHLAYQRSDGSLNDWFAGGPAENFVHDAPRVKEVFRSRSPQAGALIISADKNTTEADQESSAVYATYQAFLVTGDTGWLTKQVHSQTIIQRLDRALVYLLRHRFDRKHGLVTSAFTVDWGDVSPSYADQRAIYIDNRTPVVAGLYTNVLFYRAAHELAQMYLALDRNARAAYWKMQATSVKRNINKYLWQQARGFYRMHIPLTPTENRLDDSNIFAMGSNALAALSHIANEAQAMSIFNVAAALQKEFGVSTIASVALPPFPRGFFQHPAVNEEYSYQNGGQWDWFAGGLLLAEFERGAAGRAAEQLVAIAEKAVANKGLFEWHTRDGKGMGSPNYLGSAGALGGALFQGLFGVYLTSNSLDLRIRLREMAAKLNLYQPATGQYVKYVYQYDAASRTAKLTFESNTPGRGNVCALLPRDVKSSRLTLDAAIALFHDEKIGGDYYMCFASDWQRHVAEFQFSPRPALAHGRN